MLTIVEEVNPEKGDLVVCLDTGNIGIILSIKDDDCYLISFPAGEWVVDREDFDVLRQSGVDK